MTKIYASNEVVDKKIEDGTKVDDEVVVVDDVAVDNKVGAKVVKDVI